MEFALVAGLFFAVIFSIINAGFFLYGRNAMDHAADIGAAKIAAYGNSPTNTDQLAIAAMDSAGLTSTPLVQVTEVDVIHELQNGSTFSDDMTGCSGSECINKYTATGALKSGTTEMWLPVARNVNETPDFARLVIQYKYSLLVGATTFTMTTNNIFRLEPQE